MAEPELALIDTEQSRPDTLRQDEARPEAPRKKKLTGTQKAAVLLITLGAEASAEVFKHLKQDEVEKLANELVRQERVDIETKRQVFEEFESLYATSSLLSQGGVDYARTVLEQAMGQQKAQVLLERIATSRGQEPSDWLQHVDPVQLGRWLQNEQPRPSLWWSRSFLARAPPSCCPLCPPMSALRSPSRSPGCRESPRKRSRTSRTACGRASAVSTRMRSEASAGCRRLWTS